MIFDGSVKYCRANNSGGKSPNTCLLAPDSTAGDHETVVRSAALLIPEFDFMIHPITASAAEPRNRSALRHLAIRGRLVQYSASVRRMVTLKSRSAGPAALQPPRMPRSRRRAFRMGVFSIRRCRKHCRNPLHRVQVACTGAWPHQRGSPLVFSLRGPPPRAEYRQRAETLKRRLAFDWRICRLLIYGFSVSTNHDASYEAIKKPVCVLFNRHPSRKNESFHAFFRLHLKPFAGKP